MNLTAQKSKSKVTEMFEISTLNVKHTIKDVSDAFYAIIDGWDRHDLLFSKGYRVLCLNNKNEIIFKLKADTPSISDLLKEICAFAKQHKSKQLIIGENCLFQMSFPNDRKKKDFKLIESIAKENGVTIFDQMIVTKNSFFSTSKDKYSIQ